MSEEANFMPSAEKGGSKQAGQDRKKPARTDRQAGGAKGLSSQEAALRPPVDVIEDASGITLLADLPGMPKEKLNLQLEADSLTIEGEMALDVLQDMQSHFAEVTVPRYRRNFTLSKDLDTEQASAEFNNGVLRLHIPKAKQAQPRKIQINVA
ncbi:Molecular chaperone IbpA, HSP20 family [Noviherbaspirillum humi]|uniref:Molecular chaperone IbpA, HSP20 family n=1 Tax=Noviherbaspirillum humi TaxID=1688639 RepID=A0A239F6L7_9BURK|nr:Hsp20/alpha crystallin family protein [Noviherbaspirillum humi]SNS52437.1 Molecular chaperone IbpA, HSP20 family [Noviherbaspirillum humi]